MASLPQRIAADRGPWPTARVEIGNLQLCGRAGVRALSIAATALPLVVIAASSRASDSCMTRAEAQQRFSSSHLYWHGADHCWDATPPGLLRKAQRKNDAATRRRATIEPAPIEQPAARDPNVELAPAPAGGGDPDLTSVTTSAVTPSPRHPQEALEAVPSPLHQIERKVEPAVQRREILPALLSAIAMAMVVAILVILEWKRRDYAKRVLRFVAMRRGGERRLRPETGERVGASDRMIVRTPVRILPETIQLATAARIYRLSRADRVGALLTEAADPAADALPRTDAGSADDFTIAQRQR